MKPFALTKEDAVRRNAASHDRGRPDGTGLSWESRRGSRALRHTAEIFNFRLENCFAALEDRSDIAEALLIAAVLLHPCHSQVRGADRRRRRMDLDSIDGASRP